MSKPHYGTKRPLGAKARLRYNTGMTYTRSAKGMVWIDLVSPSEDEIASAVKRYDLHPLVGEELKSSSSSARAVFYGDHALVVLTLPVRVKKSGAYEIADREVDFVIGKNFLLTARFDAIEQMEYFAKVFETNSILDKSGQLEQPGHLFYHMVKRIYAGMIEDLENIRDTLVLAEASIFGGNERRMVEVLSGISRELIDFRQTARMHRDLWGEMAAADGRSLFGDDFVPYIRDIGEEFSRISEIATNARELLADLRETNDSLLNTRQNDIIRTLTIITFVFYPATFIAALFTIPASYVPLVDSDAGWTYILAGMVIITVGIWWVVKRKRWL